MKRLAKGSVAGAVVALLLVAHAGPAYADHSGPRTCLRIVGGVFVGGASKERLQIREMCGVDRSIAGWTVSDEAGAKYVFPAGARIGPAKRIVLYTGSGTNGAGAFYWRRAKGVWNDVPPDRASLRNPKGGLVSSWSWHTDRFVTGAGDIAVCEKQGDEATASLLDGIGGRVFTAGDNAYPDGTAEEFAECYDPTWGRHRGRTMPVPGNHEYHVSTVAQPYFDYFGDAAGTPGDGWYSRDLGAWHLVFLNNICHAVACGSSSEQATWLRADLAHHPAECTLAVWHYPRYSSNGTQYASRYTAAFWDALADAGAEVVVTGHHHHYERFAPMDLAGNLDTAGGLRQFIVGTGGAPLVTPTGTAANSEARQAESFGVLRLALSPRSYAWDFIPATGSYTDAGSSACR